jgi:hypothetical protein
MPHYPQGRRTDDLDVPMAPIIAVRPFGFRDDQSVADQGDAAYLYSHGLRWPPERPDSSTRPDGPAIQH